MGALFSVPTATEAIASLHFCDSRWARFEYADEPPRPSHLRRPGVLANPVTPADHSRPGGRVVTSWTIHRLPSGSLKAQKDQKRVRSGAGPGGHASERAVG